MRITRTKGMLLMLGCAAFLTIPAHGVEIDCSWVHPCDETNLDCLMWGCCPIYCTKFFCDADWDVSANWTGSTCVGYPNTSTEFAYISHSNTGTCDGGSDDGLACSQDSDCAGVGTCENIEEKLVIAVPTLTIEGLIVETNSTRATTDVLNVDLVAVSGSVTVTCGGLTVTSWAGDVGLSASSGLTLDATAITLDAVNGKITFGGNINTTN